MQILEALSDAFENRRDEVVRNAENVTRTITNYSGRPTLRPQRFAEKILFPRLWRSMKNRFDPVYGGFGGAPKFPHTMDLMLLMRHYRDNWG